MIEGLDDVLEGSGQPGLAELRTALGELLGGRAAPGRLIDQHRLKSRVYRLRFAIRDRDRALVVKRLDPALAQRNQLVARRWLPAVGLGHSGPPLLGIAGERSGQCVWHVYDDLGDWALDTSDPDLDRVAVVVTLIAQIHGRFAEHPLLPECRLYGGDLGIHFYASNVRDAIRGLESLRPPADELPHRAQALAELGGPETLLHGDLWTTNTFVMPTAHGLQARLIDWDHAAVGPASYDLSTFLLRFPTHHRLWIVDLYRESTGRLGWQVPAPRDLNLLFETAEYARFANRIIWPAIALWNDQAAWGFDALAEVERWFEALEPVLPV